MTDEREQRKGSVGLGLGLTVMFHVIAQAPVFFLLLAMARSDRGLELAFAPVLHIGLTQLIYIIPAILFSRHRGETETAKGLVIGAALTFLLNATCNGFLFLNR